MLLLVKLHPDFHSGQLKRCEIHVKANMLPSKCLRVRRTRPRTSTASNLAESWLVRAFLGRIPTRTTILLGNGEILKSAFAVYVILNIRVSGSDLYHIASCDEV